MDELQQTIEEVSHHWLKELKHLFYFNLALKDLKLGDWVKKIGFLTHGMSEKVLKLHKIDEERCSRSARS